VARRGAAATTCVRACWPRSACWPAGEDLQASKRLARLIDDLLSVSRMESGRLVLDPESQAG
jgi:signal transduction histidine kinase